MRSLIFNNFQEEEVEDVDCLNCSVNSAMLKAERDKNALLNLVRFKPMESIQTEIDEICRREAILKELAGAPALQSEVLGLESLADMLPAIQRIKTKSFKNVIFSKWPPMLCFHFCRVSFDIERGDTVKNLTHVAFPLEFNPSQNLSANNILSENHRKFGYKLPNWNYLLKCVIVHHGRDAAG